MNDKGFTVIAYNRTTSKVDSFLANEAKGNLRPLLVIRSPYQRSLQYRN